MKSVSEKPQHIGVDSKPKGERDKIDLNHEISGEPTGRIQRFLTENHHGVDGEGEKKRSERRYRNMLEMLLAEDARYAKLYFEVQDTLNRARQAVDQALVDIRQHLEDSERTLRLMQDNAARLDDGTMVFRSAVDGNVYTEDGRKLSDDEARNIEFPENAPSREDYNTAKGNVETAQEQIAEAEAYQRDIDQAEERRLDADNPLTLEELKIIKRDISGNQLFSYGTTAQSVNGSVAQDISEDENLDMPPMNVQFDVARLGLSDRNSLPQFTSDKTSTLTL